MPKSTGVTETQVVRAMRDWLTLKKIYHLRLQTGMVPTSYNGKKSVLNLCPTGTPDLMLVLKGKAVFVEVKRDKGEVSRWKTRIDKYLKTSFMPSYIEREVAQHKARVEIEKSGGRWFIISDLYELEELVNKVEHENDY